MENLNAEQVKKALECCASEKYLCTQCPIDEKIKDDCECGKVVARNALALINSQEQRIKELTEENDRLRNLFGKDVLDIVDYAVDKNRLAKADTAKKMHSEIKRRCIEGGIYPAFVASVIEQVAKELTDETGE